MTQDTNQDDARLSISIDEDSSMDGDGSDKVILPDGTVIDLKVEQQARIDLLYEKLESSTFYDILEVKRDAPVKAIKRAYYRLSKEFHPDKFFRKELGDYKLRLELIFAKVNEAYRVLSDDRLRDDYDVQTFADRKDEGQAAMATHEVNFVGDAMKSRAARRGQVSAKRKKGDVPHFLKSAQSELTKRLKKARKAFLLAQQHYEKQEFEEAAAKFQLAMVLDSRNEEAPRMFKKAQEQGRNTRAEAAWRQGREALESEQFSVAAQHFKTAIDCQPTRGKYYNSFGKVVWEHTMRQRTAIELLRTAVEKEPDNLEYVIDLAKAYESVGMPSNALRAFERAAQLSPNNPDVKKALKRLR